jgi:orotate phosphoribosyltransferase
MRRDIIDILKSVGGIITDDHFVYTSGMHGSVYINKDAVYPYTEKVSQIGDMFAEKCADLDIEVVVGPMIGGIILSQWTAYHLSKRKKRDVLSVYTEKDAESNQVFGRRGYDKFVKAKNVLIVEDLTNTGGSVKKVVDTVRAAGGNVMQVAVMVNRNPEKVNEAFMQAPFFSLGEFPAEAFDEADCPFCAKHIPVNIKIGHGKKFIEANHH